MKVVKRFVMFNIYKKVLFEYGFFLGVGYRNRVFIKYIWVKDLIMFLILISLLIKKISVVISIMYC